MKISLIKENKLLEYKVPTKVEGNIWLNEIDNKPNIWCGDSQAWSQISGSTQSGTLYLIY